MFEKLLINKYYLFFLITGLVAIFFFSFSFYLSNLQNYSYLAQAKTTLGRLLFDDEFNGAAGTKPSRVWTYDTGHWHNELETYTTNAANASMDGHGHLVIRAISDGKGGYTSARFHTGRSFSQLYGSVEARMKLPKGQGLLPAFWMLGANYMTVAWPVCGEIDIMEEPGDGAIHMTVHGTGDVNDIGITSQYNNIDITAWHIYGVNWTLNKIDWTVDGHVVHTLTKDQIGRMWSFDNPEFIILSLAVGGWAKNPPASTHFPAEFLIDYVRAYGA